MLINDFRDSDIAIIGISCRFPKADNLEKFWQNLKNGVECISFYTPQNTALSTSDGVKKTSIVHARGVLEDIDIFDAPFFDITPREAELLNPQHRLFLECAWQAIENAGYNVATTYEGAISLYAACGINSYHSDIHNSLQSPAEKFLALVSNIADCLATRVSYKLNLRGESIAVQTACSSSLVAVHMACQSLLNGESDMALAGGVNIATTQEIGYDYQEGMIYSPDGHCRAFDCKAKGMVEGDGVGIVVLKRLKEALQDRDYIHAVIKGSAINNDGNSKVGYTAPSVDGQAEVIATALAIADISPETIGYVEAHGTGTSLGDPIEIEALTRAFHIYTNKNNFCAVGSVKTNIGHLIHASGIAGLIKTVLSLQHGFIPPTLHFEKPNHEIDFDNSPFYVNNNLQQWNCSLKPRRAGVSSFGIGGTNAHVILEEAPTFDVSNQSQPWHLLTLSAKTSSALDNATTNMVEHLKRHPYLNLANVAYTLHVGRMAFSYRRMLVCTDLDDAVMALETLDSKRVFTSIFQEETRKDTIVFMFPGQGAQYMNMGVELYQVEFKFRKHIDICAELLKSHLELDLRDVLYPTSNKQAEYAALQLQNTAIIQPALFVVEYALAQLWIEWGVRPQAMIGHSIGEYVVACIAGVFSLEDALLLVVARGKMMQKLPSGAMLAVSLSENELQSHLSKELSLAVVNGTSLCVVSGTIDAVETLHKHLLEQGVQCRRLQTSHAFHSYMMTPILESFTERVKQVKLSSPKIPYISNVTGTWITADEATSPSYWAKHLRQTVRFAQGLHILLEGNYEGILLEVGPGRTLNTLAKTLSNTVAGAGQVVLSSLRHSNEQKKSDVAFLLNTLGKLWLAGVKVDWFGFYANEQRQRIPLPTYPFERMRYWIEEKNQQRKFVKTHKAILSQKKLELINWFYIPSWKRTKLPMPYQLGDLAGSNGKWILFIENDSFSTALIELLRTEGLSIVKVLPGESFAHLDSSTYKINYGEAAQYKKLIDHITANEGTIETILYVCKYTSTNFNKNDIEQAQLQRFYSLLFLTQALEHVNRQIYIWIVTSNAQPVAKNTSALAVENAALLGLCKVIPQEYPNITCRTVDFSYKNTETANQFGLHLEQLMAEISDPSDDPEVAYRDRNRWISVLEPINVSSQQNCFHLRQRGVYLITGGLGQVGLTLAEYFARHFQARLVLISRSGLPPEDSWSNWIAKHNEEDTVSHKIRKVWQFQKLGAEVIIRAVDVADIDQMSELLQEVHKRFGIIHGVVHAAGVVDKRHFGLIRDTTPENTEEVFKPKIKGTLVLHEVLQNGPIDFCLLCSSLSSFLGGLTYGAYTAANCFMDAFVQSLNSQSWFTINWDTWQFPSSEQPELGSGISHLSMKPDEGIKVFVRSLSLLHYKQLIISTISLHERIQHIKESFSFKTAANKVQDIDIQSHKDFQFSRLNNRKNIELTIIAILNELLSTDDIGLHDDFLTLCDSLTILNIVAIIEHKLGIKIPIAEAYSALDVSEMTDLCLNLLEKKNVAPETEQKDEEYYSYDLDIDGDIATIIIKKDDYLEHGLPEGAKNFRKSINK